MENKIKVNDYIRTTRGIILKVIEIDWDEIVKQNYYSGDEPCLGCFDEMIKTYSANLIDIIVEGDYVNRRKVQKVFIDPFTKKKRIELEGMEVNWQGDMSSIYCEADEIDEIITKEQFEFITYKVKKEEN